jgi:hypothetical protein
MRLFVIFAAAFVKCRYHFVDIHVMFLLTIYARLLQLLSTVCILGNNHFKLILVVGHFLGLY